MATSDPSTWKLPRLKIDREGDWLHEDEEVTHAGILAHLRNSLRVDAAGHYLQIGPVRAPVDVEDAPFVILRVEREGERLMLTLNDLSREFLEPGTLRFGVGGVPYCRVKDGHLEARLSRAATYQLFQYVEGGGGEGEGVLVLGDARHALPPSSPTS
jgi:hypothetical protein